MLEELTVGGLLRRTAARFPDRPALEYEGSLWTYARMDAEVDLMAERLLAHGVQKGERVGIWCEAVPEAVFAFCAVTRIGAVAAMLNTGLQRGELLEILKRTEITRLLIGSGYRECSYPLVCRGLKEELPSLKTILFLEQERDSGEIPKLKDTIPAGRDSLSRAEQAVFPQDTCCILYTSGTTSFPKAVMGSHFSRVNCGIAQARDMKATERDRFCVALPLFHCFCLSVNIMAACAVGACLYIPASRKTTALLDTISKNGCTILSCVPTLFHAMLCRPDFKSWDISSLRTGVIGGCMYPPSLFAQIEQAFGMTLLSSLGQTEATGGLTVSSLEDSLEVRANTVGHFMEHLDGCIMDPQTREKKLVGENGEICVKGYVVMQGYYRQPEETRKVIDQDGWLHTGDMGYLDEDGNVHMSGRLKELIIRGGENISPVEIEEVAMADERIESCKAVGVPDEHYGEEVCLCVIPVKGCQCTQEQLRESFRGRLADFKIPRYILLMEEFPLSSTGKIKVGELKKLAERAVVEQR